MTRNTFSFYDSLRLAYELFTDYYECLRVLYEFIVGSVTMALRILTSYYEHFTCCYEYNTYTLRMLTYFWYNCNLFLSYVSLDVSCQLSNDDTLRFAGFIYLLAENRKDS